MNKISSLPYDYYVLKDSKLYNHIVYELNILFLIDEDDNINNKRLSLLPALSHQNVFVYIIEESDNTNINNLKNCEILKIYYDKLITRKKSFF